MTYTRVIPRDLFNEASLLKCLGQLWLKLESYGGEHLAEWVEPEPGDGFDVEQAEADGSLFCWNCGLKLGGEHIILRRPLNSREPWPLIAIGIGSAELDEEIPVFTEAGEPTPEFLALISPHGGA